MCFFQNLAPDPSEKFVWESCLHLKIYVVFKDFFRQKKNYVKHG